MIDGLFKRHIDPVWSQAATVLIRAGLTPNQVTVGGLLLVVASAGAFLWHDSTLVFGICLGVAFAGDSLDGAVARRTGRSTRFGGYLDAVVDRYQEAIVLIALAIVCDVWAVATIGLVGSFLTSYAKARVAIEMPISNDGWPDLFERLERALFMIALLLADGIAGAVTDSRYPLVWGGLVLFAVVTNVTAIQRMARARRLLTQEDRGKDGLE